MILKTDDVTDASDQPKVPFGTEQYELTPEGVHLKDISKEKEIISTEDMRTGIRFEEPTNKEMESIPASMKI